MKTKYIFKFINKFCWDFTTLLFIFSFILALFTMPDLFQTFEVVNQGGGYYEQQDPNALQVSPEHPRARFILDMWGRIEPLIFWMIIAILLEFWLKNRKEIEMKYLYGNKEIDFKSYAKKRDWVLLHFNKIKRAIRW